MNRIAIVGTTGSGKTTLGEQLSSLLGYRFVDLDTLFQEANWTRPPPEVMVARTSAVVGGEQWITAGNYSRVRSIIWGRADTVIWLDYPLKIIYPRLLRRTMRRVIRRDELWNGNRETLRGQYMSRDSLFLYAAQTHGRKKREFAAELARPEFAHLRLLHFTTPQSTEHWLSELARPGLAGDNH